MEYAKAIGLIDDIIIQDGCCPSNFSGFQEQIVRIAEKLAHAQDFNALQERKRQARQADEKIKPLEHNRLEELEEMNQNFCGEYPAYHVARSAFVRKLPRLGNLQCSANLKQVCGNAQCDEALASGRNRCAFSMVGHLRRV